MLTVLRDSQINPTVLSRFNRILLTTDGTLTEILEAYLLEPIILVKLDEHLLFASGEIPALRVNRGAELIKRTILLQGGTSGRNYVYAESLIVVDRVDHQFKDDLLRSKVPLGRLWLEHRMETFKEMVELGMHQANGLASYFGILPDDQILFRTYCVFSKRQPVILITEKFPAQPQGYGNDTDT